MTDYITVYVNNDLGRFVELKDFLTMPDNTKLILLDAVREKAIKDNNDKDIIKSKIGL